MKGCKLILFLITILLISCDGGYIQNDSKFNSKLVDKKAKFIGTELTVKNADKKWDWYLPDLDSVVQKNNEINNSHYKYIRSFTLYDDVGYVWLDKVNGIEFFLMYVFSGNDGYILRLLENTQSITLDEAILAVYFDGYYFSMEKFEIEKWEITQAPGPYQPESFGFTGNEFFNENKEAFIFENRVVTLTYLVLDYKNNQVNLCNNYYENCFDLPNRLTKFFVDKDNKSILNNLPKAVTLKVKIDANGKIKDILAGGIHEDENDGFSFVWPMNKGELGAGSLPLIIY